jgi:3-hydroxyisobutyrate dehydrogenase
MAQPERIGFVGIGNMGAPMVRCLVMAGHRVAIFDAAPPALAPFRGPGDAVTIAPDLATLAAASSLVITMLPDSRVVRQVVLGDAGHGGLVERLARGSIIVDMSSSYAPDTVKLGAELASRGIALVDAPVSGGVPKAVAGTLAIMAGGCKADVGRVASTLAAMGTVLETGPLGSGHALKALNNYVSAAGLVATCEALAIGMAFGLDPTVIVKVLNASTGRNNSTENKADRYLVPRKFDSGFSLSLMAKDVGMAQALAEDSGIAADELEFVLSLLKRAQKVLGPDADHTAVMAFVDPREDG